MKVNKVEIQCPHRLPYSFSKATSIDWQPSGQKAPQNGGLEGVKGRR